MNRETKAEFVDSFREDLRNAPLVVVASYGGTPVNRSNQLRRSLETKGLKLRVVKNTLARLALEGTGRERLEGHFKGMTAVILSGDDAIGGAKALREALVGLETVEVRAGFFEGEVLDPQGVKAVADLPSREELLSLLLRTIQEPARRVLGILQAPARDLLYLLKNYESKLSEEEGA